MAQVAPPTVVLGTDYFRTLPGTYDTLPGVGIVDFVGVPIGPGAADTIIERTSDIVIGASATTSVNLLMTALSLQSAAPVSLPGGDPFIYATLDPDIASTGTMAIMGTLAGGTFSSTLDVHFDICLAPGADGVGCAAGTPLLFAGELTLTDTNSPWGPTMPANPVAVVTGLVGDQAANVHTNLESWQTDFGPSRPAARRPPAIPSAPTSPSRQPG